MQRIKNLTLAGSNQRPIGFDIFYVKDGLPKPIIIYVHGFNGFKDWANFDLIAEQFAKAGYFFIKMNLSHNGTTPECPLDFVDLEAFGNNNFSKELFDVEKMIDWICDTKNPYHKAINIHRLTLLGHSRGGGVAILKAATDHRVAALITWASIAEAKTPWGNKSPEKIKEWKDEGVFYYHNKRTNQKLPIYYQLYEDYLMNEKSLNIQSAIKALDIPILICHGTNDEAVPIGKGHLLNQWQPKAAFFSVDSDHVFGRKHPWNENYLPEAMQLVLDKSIWYLKQWVQDGKFK